MRKSALLIALCTVVVSGKAPLNASAHAETRDIGSSIHREPFSPSSVRARFAINSATYSNEDLTIEPIVLAGGSTVTLISPERWDGTGAQIVEAIERAHTDLSGIFGEIPPFISSVRLMERSKFTAYTKAPEWTNALFYKKEILIPLDEGELSNMGELIRAARHEYTHAVINKLTAGRCPGWLDEGLAQLIEGPPNPALALALRKWLEHRNPILLEELQGGFTKLSQDVVPAAYAESLYAAKLLTERYGTDAIRRYFTELSEQPSRDANDAAFKEAFNLSEEAFQRELNKSLGLWKNGIPIVRNTKGVVQNTFVAGVDYFKLPNASRAITIR